MNIKEAESFFKRFHGHHYHMLHDETPLYREYRKTWENTKYEEKWRQELLQEKFANFYEKRDQIWLKHGHIIKIMCETKNGIPEYSDKLVSLMEELYDLDKKQKILIIENMAGRRFHGKNTQNDGGCYLICSRTSLGERMNEVMKKFMDFECREDDNLNERGWSDMRERHFDAVNNYERAYNKFKSIKKD
ncbi:MAG: hypothetical protein J6C06_10340 [Lachnospiraceae bacterium]|nr:hypothetical protein [Lachnospiraceae bacterium]